MREAALLLCETGLPATIPGFIPDYPACNLPFWGNFYFGDFFRANFSGLPETEKYMVIKESQQEKVGFIAKRWPDFVLQPLPARGQADFFLDWLKKIPQDMLILSTLSFVSIFSGDEIDLEKMTHELVKFSIDNIPVDLFIAKKIKLISLLDKNSAKLAQTDNFLAVLVKDILNAGFESMENIPGKVLFHYNLMQYYEQSLKYIEFAATEEYSDVLLNFKMPEKSLKEAYIAPNGSIKDSFISNGVEVYGYVENSLLFPGVTIMKDARIINSVILNDNKIGNKTQIENTLVLPFIRVDAGLKSNIEDHCQIGNAASSIKNHSYPEQVYNGVTALGMNVRIPRGYTIEPGCFIAADVPLARIKQFPKLKQGKSIINLS